MGPHPHVLVADDDVLFLAAVAESFERLGAKVIRAESGAELIDRLASEGPFDLVVTDVSMPWMNGLQAMHAARTAGLGTSVIIMTALNDDSIAAQVRALGRHATLLRKPFALHELETVATQLLASMSSHWGARTSLPAPDPTKPGDRS
jgi:CheY-like chemotaxis protein